MPVGYPWFVRFLFFWLATTLSGLLPVLLVIIQMECRQISELGELRYYPFPLSPQKKTPKKQHKNKGVGRFLFLTHCLSHLLQGPAQEIQAPIQKVIPPPPLFGMATTTHPPLPMQQGAPWVSIEVRDVQGIRKWPQAVSGVAARRASKSRVCWALAIL
jgi:hypothetical protein